MIDETRPDPSSDTADGEASAGEVLLRHIAQAAVERVDLKVTDLFGRWHHLSLAVGSLDAAALEHGWPIDAETLPGVGLRGGERLRLRPDPGSAVLDPTADRPTLSLLCDVVDAVSGAADPACPRATARRAEAYLARQEPGLVARYGPTVEFFVFDDVRFQQGSNAAFYAVESLEGAWNSGTEESPNLGYTLAPAAGWGVLDGDVHAELRAEIVATLEAIGIAVRADHHGPAGAGHQSITLAASTPVAIADAVQWVRHIARAAARRRGHVVTFMPRPLGSAAGQGSTRPGSTRPGSTLAMTQSLWAADDAPVLADANGYGGLSREGRWFVGGLLRHGPSITALLMPTTNSYRAFDPASGAPVHLIYGMRATTGAVRIPQGDSAPAGAVAYRAVDAAANPYLAVAALAVAGLDGIRAHHDAGDPVDRPTDALDAAAVVGLRTLPTTLGVALDALEAATDLLTRDEVFTPELLDGWCTQKRAEVARVAAEPTPQEYELYFNG